MVLVGLERIVTVMVQIAECTLEQVTSVSQGQHTETTIHACPVNLTWTSLAIDRWNMQAGQGGPSQPVDSNPGPYCCEATVFSTYGEQMFPPTKNDRAAPPTNLNNVGFPQICILT